MLSVFMRLKQIQIATPSRHELKIALSKRLTDGIGADINIVELSPSKLNINRQLTMLCLSRMHVMYHLHLVHLPPAHHLHGVEVLDIANRREGNVHQNIFDVNGESMECEIFASD